MSSSGEQGGVRRVEKRLIMDDKDTSTVVLELRDKNISFIHEKMESCDNEMQELLMNNENDMSRAIEEVKTKFAKIADDIRKENTRKKSRLQGLLNLERYQLGVLEHLDTDNLLHIYSTFEKDVEGIEASIFNDSAVSSPSTSQNGDLSYVNVEKHEGKDTPPHPTPPSKHLLHGDHNYSPRGSGPSNALTMAVDIVNRCKSRGGLLPRPDIYHGSDPTLIQEYKDANKLKIWRLAMQGSDIYYLNENVKDFLNENLPGWSLEQRKSPETIEVTEPPDSNVSSILANDILTPAATDIVFLRENDVDLTRHRQGRCRSISPRRKCGAVCNTFKLGNSIVSLGDVVKNDERSPLLKDRSYQNARFGESTYHNGGGNVVLSGSQGGYSAMEMQNSLDVRALDAAIERVKLKSSKLETKTQYLDYTSKTDGTSASGYPSPQRSANPKCHDSPLRLDLREVLKKFDNKQVLPRFCDSNYSESTTIRNCTPSFTSWDAELCSIRNLKSGDRKPRWGAGRPSSPHRHHKRSASSSPQRKNLQSNQSHVVTYFQSGKRKNHISPYLSFDDHWKRRVFDYEVLSNKPSSYSQSLLARIVGFQVQDNQDCYDRFIEIWNTDVFKISVLNVFCNQFRLTKRNAAVRARGLFQSILIDAFPLTSERVKLLRIKISNSVMI